MVRIAATAFLVALGASTAFASATCGPGSKCPADTPCCSQYGQCGVGAYCLGGCDPQFSNSLDSCVPEPVCKNGNFQMTSMDRITSNTKYLGDPSKTDWVMDGQAVAYQNSILLTMAPDTVGTVLSSSTYMWYGKVSAKLKTSRGRGVVTSFILFSDVRDEIDYEFVGVGLETAQTNYYWQGVTNYENSANISLSDTFNNFHTYEINWTPDQITWSVDGQVGRTKKRSETWNSTSNTWNYPQTPARVQFSLWPGGLPTNGKGTIDWAGGVIDFSNANQDIKTQGYYYATLSEVKMECYQASSGPGSGSGTSYVYNNVAGTNDTVQNTDKPTVLKSLLGTGSNMSADYPSASSSGTATDVATVPGLSGAGPGTNGQRGNDGSGSDSGSGSGSGGGSSGTGSAPSSQTSCSGFCQGGSSNNKNAATGQQERVLQGSFFAGLVAVVALLAL